MKKTSIIEGKGKKVNIKKFKEEVTKSPVTTGFGSIKTIPVKTLSVNDENKKIESSKKTGKCPYCGGKMSWKSRKLYGYYDVMGIEHHYSCDKCMWVADSDVDI